MENGVANHSRRLVENQESPIGLVFLRPACSTRIALGFWSLELCGNLDPDLAFLPYIVR